MSESDAERRAHGQDPDILYRPFNPLSLVAIVLALFAPLAIAHAGFIVPALVALLTSIIAALRCEGGRKMSGYALALSAVFLSTAGIVLGVSYRTGRTYWLVTLAKGHAERVHEEIQADHLEEVLAYSTEPGWRPVVGTSLVDWYEITTQPPGLPAPPAADINFWMSMPPMRFMVDDQLNGRHEYMGLVDVEPVAANLETLVLRYRYHPQSGEDDLFDYNMHFERYRYADPIGAQWRVWLAAIAPKGGAPVRESWTPSLEPRKRIRRPLDDRG